MVLSASAGSRHPARREVPGQTEAHYKAAFDILERCDAATCISDFKGQVVEALGSVMGFEHVSFFAGPTFQTTFGDRTPIVGGVTERMLPEYEDRWWKYDLFSSSAALQMIMSGGVASLSQLISTRSLPATADAYVRHFLVNTWGIHAAAAIRVDLFGSHTGLIGIFSRREGSIDTQALATLRLVSKTLSAVGRGIPFVDYHAPLSELSARQHEVVRLIADGLSNAQIATALCLAEDSVKKYVSRILAASGCQTRMELAILARAHA